MKTETHWKTLANLSIQNKNLIVAERCYSTIGCYSKANYIKKVMKYIENNNLTIDHQLIEARLLILDKQFNNLYSSDIENAETDMKVLNNILKSDGFNDIELIKEDKDE